MERLRPPSLPHFSGEGNLVGEDIFERWVENFELELRVGLRWSENIDSKCAWIRLHSKLTKVYPKELW